MGIVSSIAGMIFGNNPIKAAIDGLNAAYKDKLTAANDADKIDADRRIAMGEQQVKILQNATQVRLATAGYPEQRFLAFLAGATAIVHWVMIGIGTTFAAPLGWGWLEWTLHIPPFPAPFADYEGAIILSFFGLVGAVSVGNSIAAALAMRRIT